MGEVVTAGDDEPVVLSVSVAGTAPIERIEIRNGMRVLRTLRTYSKSDLGNRVKLLWHGATVRGRGRQVNWDGLLKLNAARIQSFETINFWNQEKRCEQLGPRELQWKSLTTGGLAGVILELDRLSGDLHVETTQKSFQTEVSKLGIKGRQHNAGGIEKCISAYRLPPASGSRELKASVRIRPGDLQPGDNPLYVCVVQEDGHMAWSSPIYALVR